jgi:hypothetical protein
MADLNIVPRYDGNRYMEGFTLGQGFVLGLAHLSWLMPGETYTPYQLSNAGRVYLPIMNNFTPGTVTDICTAPDPAKADGEWVQMQLDKQASGIFDGCFTVNGIAELNWQMLMNNATFRTMAIKQYQQYIMDEVIAEGTAVTSTYDLTKPWELINDMAQQFFASTGYEPTYALVSPAMMTKLIAEKLVFPAVDANGEYTTGRVTTTIGITLIRTLLPAGTDIIMGVPRSINIVTASNKAQATPLISSGVNILGGAVDQGTLDQGGDIRFDSGFVSMLDVDPKNNGLKANTYVFYPFGVYVQPELVLMYQETVTP